MRIRGYTLDSPQLFVRLFYWFFGYIDLKIISHKSGKISKIWWKVSRKYSLFQVLTEIKSINRKTFGQKLVKIRGVASDSHILVPWVNDTEPEFAELTTGGQFSFSLKLKSLLRKCRTPKFWVMDFNSQHFRLKIANFYKKSLFID